jgi:hypothetical protein
MIRGVVEGVGHDEVGLAGDGRDDARVGGEAGLEGEDRGDLLEGRQLRLERLVHRHRAGDGADGAGARPKSRTAATTASQIRGWLVRPR